MPQEFLLDLPVNFPDKDRCTFKVPPLDGSLTIPDIFNWHFVNNPSHPVFVYEANEGIVRLPFSSVVPAMHKAACRYVAAINGETVIEPMPPVAILATADTPSYFCTLVGLMLAGIPSFPLSPRNPPSVIAHLLLTTKVCHIIVGNDSNLEDLAAKSLTTIRNDGHETPNILSMATFRDLFTDESQISPLEPRYTEQMRDYHRPVLYVHSSGSSSLPKPIPWNHASLLQVALTPYLGAFDLRGEIFGAHAVPMFHASGLNFIPWVAGAGFTMAIFSPTRSIPIFPTPENVLAGLRACKASFLICVPSFLERWANDAAAVEALKSLKAVAYGGGPLSSEIGDHLTEQGVKIITVFGSTEAGVIGSLFSDYQGRDWQYFSVNPHCAAKFDMQGAGVYELIIVKQPTQVLSITNTTFKGVEAYATRDLFSPHPTKSGFWKACGRTDDQIIFSTGSKIHPGPLEAFISRHALIEAALMFGTGHFQAGVIIFPSMHCPWDTEDPDGRRNFIAEIWNQIDQSNANSPTYSRIFRETILIAMRDKPPSLTNKGTIRRAATLKLYEDEISELYRNLESGVPSVPTTETPKLSSWTSEIALTFVRESVRQVLPGVLSDHVNLFSIGCDSLKANWIRTIIINALHQSMTHKYDVPSSLVYRFPSIAALSQFILDIINPTQGVQSASAGKEELLETLARFKFEGLVRQQREGNRTLAGSPIALESDEFVLVTGTTGSLGSHVLSILSALPRVKRIYALNRRSSTATILSRQRLALLGQRLSSEIAESPTIVYIECDLESGNLELDPALEDMILTSVTHIIHLGNALLTWPMNFNIGLSSFDGALATLRALIALAIHSKNANPPRFIFASSVGIYTRFGPHSPYILREAHVDDPDLVSSTGYCQSKWIAERMLAIASQETRLQPVIARIGQLTGSSSGGIWNPSEWLPSMVKTSIGLGFLPQVPGVISWVPVDIAAKAIIEIKDVPQHVLHIVHPRPVQYSQIVEYLSTALSLPSRPYNEWLQDLRAVQHSTDRLAGPERTTDSDILEKLPALKLLDFFALYDGRQDLSDFKEAFAFCDATFEEGVKYSPSLRTARSTDQNEVSLWVEGWKTIQFLL